MKDMDKTIKPHLLGITGTIDFNSEIKFVVFQVCRSECKNMDIKGWEDGNEIGPRNY